MLDQRNGKRYRTIWKVYFKQSDQKYHFAGYLMDISAGGARFFLDKLDGVTLEEHQQFKVVIKPEGLEKDPQAISVETAWIKEWDTEKGTCEMGVRFCQDCEADQKYVDLLIEKFEAESRVNAEAEIQLDD